jgi:hypothetical protein
LRRGKKFRILLTQSAAISIQLEVDSGGKEIGKNDEDVCNKPILSQQYAHRWVGSEVSWRVCPQ